jgi:hypothetical protein
VLGIWGDEFLSLIENPLAWFVGGLLGLLLIFPLMGWWTGLAEAVDSE